jgi:hypothetical protein
MDSTQDASGIVYDTREPTETRVPTETREQIPICTTYNTSNGNLQITLTISPTHILQVNLVDFNNTYYISCDNHIHPLSTFYALESASETADGLAVLYNENGQSTTYLYKTLTAPVFATIMAAVEDAIVDYDISTRPPVFVSEIDAESESEAQTDPSILDRIISKPDPDSLHSPNSTPLTTADQISFAIGLAACILAILHTMYLGIYAATR